jgi:hypothetical protein
MGNDRRLEEVLEQDIDARQTGRRIDSMLAKAEIGIIHQQLKLLESLKKFNKELDEEKKQESRSRSILATTTGGTALVVESALFDPKKTTTSKKCRLEEARRSPLPADDTFSHTKHLKEGLAEQGVTSIKLR